MTVEKINSTNYANIYGIYDNAGKPIGTVQVTLAGRDAGTHAYTLSGKYTRSEIIRIYKKFIH